MKMLNPKNTTYAEVLATSNDPRVVDSIQFAGAIEDVIKTVPRVPNTTREYIFHVDYFMSFDDRVDDVDLLIDIDDHRDRNAYRTVTVSEYEMSGKSHLDTEIWLFLGEEVVEDSTIRDRLDSCIFTHLEDILHDEEWRMFESCQIEEFADIEIREYNLLRVNYIQSSSLNTVESAS